MDFYMIAGQLLDIQFLMSPEPVSRLLYAFENGTFLALQYLAQKKSGVHPKELSVKMAVSSARIAALLNHMERDGLIVRTPDLKDNRQIIISLTAHGEQLVMEKKAEMTGILAEALKELGQEDAETYLRIRQKLFQSVSHITKERALNKKAPEDAHCADILPDAKGKTML